MRTRMLAVGFALVIGALGFNIYLNLHTSSRLTATVNASAHTRITTVTQRCALTQKIANFALHTEQVLVRFVPSVVPPFSKDYAGFEASYQACEKQLVTVKKIANRAP